MDELILIWSYGKKVNNPPEKKGVTHMRIRPLTRLYWSIRQNCSLMSLWMDIDVCICCACNTCLLLSVCCPPHWLMNADLTGFQKRLWELSHLNIVTFKVRNSRLARKQLKGFKLFISDFIFFPHAIIFLHFFQWNIYVFTQPLLSLHVFFS